MQKGRGATVDMAASREAKKPRRKHLTREKREEASRLAFNAAKKSDSIGEAAEAIAKIYGVSKTTAQSWIRRGRHLADKAKKARETTRR
ncbi:transposase [Bradyrhizobium sp. USDA 4473]